MAAAATATMQEIIASVDHIKFDLEIAVEQQLGAQPLPFPGMDSERGVGAGGRGARPTRPQDPHSLVSGRPPPQFGSSSPSVPGLLSPNPGNPPFPLIWTRELPSAPGAILRQSSEGQDHVRQFR